MVATTANAPETCVLFLSGVVWGSGASEGTKHEVSTAHVFLARPLHEAVENILSLLPSESISE